MNIRLLSLLLTVLLVAALSTAAFASVAGQNKGDLPQVDATMTLDGKKDAAYADAFTLSFNRSNENNPTDEKAKAYLVWTDGTDTDYIWCYVEVKDADITAGAGEFYAVDSVEFFLNFENSDADTDIYQHIIDASGRMSEYSGPKSIDIRIDGALDQVGTVSGGGVDYFSGCATQTADGYAVEFRVPCSLSAGQEVAYCMTIHDLPSWAWYICEGSLPFVNWNAGCFDYMTVKALPTQQPDQPSQPSQPSQPDNPSTGDSALLAVAIACVASAGIVLTVGKKRA